MFLIQFSVHDWKREFLSTCTQTQSLKWQHRLNGRHASLQVSVSQPSEMILITNTSILIETCRHIHHLLYVSYMKKYANVFIGAHQHMIPKADGRASSDYRFFHAIGDSFWNVSCKCCLINHYFNATILSRQICRAFVVSGESFH